MVLTQWYNPCEFSNTPHATCTPATQWPHRGNRRRSAAARKRFCRHSSHSGLLYADAPQACFRIINATFAVSRVRKPLTKFYWALSKLPATLVDTIGPLCDDPSTAEDPYAELQRIVLRPYGLSDRQRTVK
jgi:hypothetical protein